MVRPSLQPSSCSRCAKAATHWLQADGVPAPKTPMVGSLPACCARAASGPGGRCAAERGQQFPPSDGDCHAPLPCEVRGNDTTPRACRLHVQGGHCSISARLADGGAFLASIDLIEVGCEGDEAGQPTGRLKAAELRKGRGTTTGSPVPPGQWMLRTAGPIANCIYAQAAIRPRCRTRISPAPQMLRAGLAFPLLTRKHVDTRTMRKRKALIFAATTILVSPVYSETCPDPLAEASRLVLVTTRSMDTQLATMQLFTRQSTNKPWKHISAAEPAVVGKAGLGWGYSVLDLKDREEPEKVEGDKRTPAGFFRIGASFGFAPSRRPGYIELKAGETVCVEDPSSPFYNTITKRSEIGSVEADDMRSSPLYRSGLFVDYPSDRATRRGSCILIHIWSAPDRGTAGCVGLPEARVEALQEFSRAGTVIAILPATAFDRFPGCLPAPTVRPAASTSANR